MFRSARRLAAILLHAAALAVVGAGCGSGGVSPVRTDAAAVVGAHGEPLPESYIMQALEGTGGRVIRWSRSTIPVWMDTLNTPENWRDEHATFVLEALDQWAAGSAGRLAFTVIPQAVNPCIQVRWVKMNPMGMSDAGAVTQLQTAPGGRSFTGVHIEIRTTDPRGRPESDLLMRTFSAHELGHAIGIWGHSDRTTDVMYHTAGYADAPSQRDLNTLARIYSLAPDMVESADASRVRGVPFITMP